MVNSPLPSSPSMLLTSILRVRIKTEALNLTRKRLRSIIKIYPVYHTRTYPLRSDSVASRLPRDHQDYRFFKDIAKARNVASRQEISQEYISRNLHLPWLREMSASTNLTQLALSKQKASHNNWAYLWVLRKLQRCPHPISLNNKPQKPLSLRLKPRRSKKLHCRLWTRKSTPRYWPHRKHLTNSRRTNLTPA